MPKSAVVGGAGDIAASEAPAADPAASAASEAASDGGDRHDRDRGGCADAGAAASTADAGLAAREDRAPAGAEAVADAADGSPGPAPARPAPAPHVGDVDEVLVRRQRLLLRRGRHPNDGAEGEERRGEEEGGEGLRTETTDGGGSGGGNPNRHKPWQWDWKGPHWQPAAAPPSSGRRRRKRDEKKQRGGLGGEEEGGAAGGDGGADEEGLESFQRLLRPNPLAGDDAGAGVPLDHAAARVSAEEVRARGGLTRDEGRMVLRHGGGDEAGDGDDDCGLGEFVLTVTLLDTIAPRFLAAEAATAAPRRPGASAPPPPPPNEAQGGKGRGPREAVGARTDEGSSASRAASSSSTAPSARRGVLGGIGGGRGLFACADSVLVELVHFPPLPPDPEPKKIPKGLGDPSGGGGESAPGGSVVDANTAADGTPSPLPPAIRQSRLLRWPASARIDPDGLVELLDQGQPGRQEAEAPLSPPSSSSSSSSSDGQEGEEAAATPPPAASALLARAAATTKRPTPRHNWLGLPLPPSWFGASGTNSGRRREPPKSDGSLQAAAAAQHPPSRTHGAHRRTAGEGLVAACWCRLPRSRRADAGSSDEGGGGTADAGDAGDGAATTRAKMPWDDAREDAMDVVRFLSLGLPAAATAAAMSSRVDPASQPAASPRAGEEAANETATRELYLALLSNTGTAYLYCPWTLLGMNLEALVSQHPTSVAQAGLASGRDAGAATGASWDQGMDSWWFGPNLFSTVHRQYEPLSQPLRSVKLSVHTMLKSGASDRRGDWERVERRILQEVDSDDEGDHASRMGVIAENENDPGEEGEDDNLDKEEAEAEDDRVVPDLYDAAMFRPKEVSAWDPAVWDSWVDPATLPHETRDNVPVRCVAAWEHLCVLGKGRRCRRNRGRRHRFRRRRRRGWRRRRDGDWQSLGDGASSEEASVGTSNSATSRIRSYAGGDRSNYSALASTLGTNLSQELVERYHDGGFVTFFSLRTFSQVRTLYLPFVPRDISPFVWGDMLFVLVLGHRAAEAVAIRVDSGGTTALSSGDDPGKMNRSEAAVPPGARDGATASTPSHVQQLAPTLTLHRFQMLSVNMPDTEDLTPLAVGCEMHTSPPSMVLVFVDEHGGQLSVIQRTFSGIVSDFDQLQHSVERPSGFREAKGEDVSSLESSVIAPLSWSVSSPLIATEHSLAHSGRITLPHDAFIVDSDERSSLVTTWCKAGQGWCVFGVANHRYFACWEGSTAAHGTFVADIGYDDQDMETCQSVVANILPIDPFLIKPRGIPVQRSLPHDVLFPFTGPSRRSIFVRDMQNRQPPILGHVSGDFEAEALDDIIVAALHSISSQTYRETVSMPSPPMSPRRLTTSFTHVEKSERLLRQCSSWTQLEKSSARRSRFYHQVPTVSARVVGPVAQSGSYSFLSLRKVVLENGCASPFQQVLSWLLAERDDYFAAASVALDLMSDGHSLRLLWKAFGKIDDEDELQVLEGLLDGILPLHESGQRDNDSVEATRTQLADMTVGCLTKGGYDMSSTLEHFLEYDHHYDTSRASLMLAATAACLVSENEETRENSRYCDSQSVDRILWPVRCLLKASSARDSLATALLLLNAAIPDELRRRNRRGIAAVSIPSLDLCLSLISLIVASSSDAAELLLHLTDENSKLPFWESVSHETQLEISLIETDGDYIMVRQPEVRSWILQQLQKQLVSDRSVVDALPSRWLQKVNVCCLSNAGCQYSLITLGSQLLADATAASVQREVERYGAEIDRVRDFVKTAKPGALGLDFDIVIPALLILWQRAAAWSSNESSTVPTQTLLNALCYLAGRRPTYRDDEKDEVEEAPFSPDLSTMMRQCALANNVQAGANLIGGSNGIVLECCDLLITHVGLSMEAAESFLLSEVLVDISSSLSKSHTENVFSLGGGHTHLLWLLERHVLDVRTYGEFEATARGTVDPVFASRVCLRTWYLLTYEVKREGAACLTGWLRAKLGMEEGRVSPRRLACAALARALLWQCEHPLLRSSHSDSSASTAFVGSSSEEFPHHLVLAAQMEVSVPFLVSLVRSCQGLVESLPRCEAEVAAGLSSHRRRSLHPGASAAESPRSSLVVNNNKDASFVSARYQNASSFINESTLDDSFASAASSFLGELDLTR